MVCILRKTIEAEGLTVSQVSRQAHVASLTIARAGKGIAVTFAYASRIVKALNDLSGGSYTIEDLGISTIKSESSSSEFTDDEEVRAL